MSPTQVLWITRFPLTKLWAIAVCWSWINLRKLLFLREGGKSLGFFLLWIQSYFFSSITACQRLACRKKKKVSEEHHSLPCVEAGEYFPVWHWGSKLSWSQGWAVQGKALHLPRHSVGWAGWEKVFGLNSSSRGTFLTAERDPEWAMGFLSPAEVPHLGLSQGWGEAGGGWEAAAPVCWAGGTVRGSKTLDLSL